MTRFAAFILTLAVAVPAWGRAWTHPYGGLEDAIEICQAEIAPFVRVSSVGTKEDDVYFRVLLHDMDDAGEVLGIVNSYGFRVIRITAPGVDIKAAP